MMLLRSWIILCLFGIQELHASCRWGKWNECSNTCGGGTRKRTGSCDGWWFSTESKTEESKCNEICNNGGRFANGICNCPARYTGRCCDALKPCSQSNGGCAETCRMETVEIRGWFNQKLQAKESRCGCQRKGYQLSMDGRSCIDINECSLGRCDHICKNTPGSFTCSCRRGYTLAADGTTCTDINECTTNQTKCEHECINLPGSFRCRCRDGYKLDKGYLCKDLNECLTNNGGCSHACTNDVGSYHCGCPSGYRIDHDRKTCKDIDECSVSHSTCSQNCINTVGSFRCECHKGYRLAQNGITCEDIDDCIGVRCQNGGLCIDSTASYTCSCQRGFTGRHCENDIDECAGVYNGGCEVICINTVGSFRCECPGNRTLLPDGLFCSGGSNKLTVFQKHSIVRQLLPRGCSTIELTRCTEGINVKLLMSSTSPWYRLKTNSSILFTQGIVFVELNGLSLPVSMTGMELLKQDEDLTLTVGSLKYIRSDGVVASHDSRANCWSFEITPRDIHDFLTSFSFLKTLFEGLDKFLPHWLKFSNSGTSIFELVDMRTDLLHGYDLNNDAWCKGAPVQQSHLYSIFKFGGSMSISVYGNQINLPKPLDGKKMCFIVDICQDYGGSVFLMLPEESRDLLEKFEMFKTLKDSYGLQIRPQGIGLSITRGINVHSQTTELQLWNGDDLFKYPVFPDANLWIGGDARMNFSVFELSGKTDLFLKIPSPLKILKSVFLDEWDLLMTTEVSADMVLRFKILGVRHIIRFRDLGVANVDMYASLGGVQHRKWCGADANPPGIFLSMMVRVNPFRNIPILKDWVFDFSSRLYVFFTTDPGSRVNESYSIDIMSDIIQLDQMLGKFMNLSMVIVKNYGILLANESMSIANDLKESLATTQAEIHAVMTASNTATGILSTDWKRIGAAFAELWEGWEMTKKDTRRFIDSFEFNTKVAKYNFSHLFSSEVDRIELSLNRSVGKLTKQIFHVLRDFEGVGFRFRATLHIFHLKIGQVELEAVYSVSSLGECSKFKHIFEIFKNEKSFRFMGTFSPNLPRLGFFLRLDTGVGIGMAFSVDKPGKFLIQTRVQASILGINAVCDLFISDQALYFNLEGKLWNAFLARLVVSADHGKDWDQLSYNVHGELLANANKDENFQDSYIDALRKVINDLGNAATKRVSQAQNALTNAQSGLTKAQNWLESKKADIRGANRAFDNAVHALDGAKDVLEKAKGPFKAAIAKLNQAQRHLDSLCKIESCSKVCIPGFKCSICFKKVWFLTIPYPCCHLTSCMLSFPNPICVAKNIGCRAVRAIAYVALEAAKIFVRIPMLALDAAKVGVSVAQIVVDKSRIVLDLAVAAIDLAKLGLEGAKGILEGAKLVLEGVKQVVKIGLRVVDLILKYGLQSLIDVKNCHFDINVSMRSLPVFEVGCEVNALRLGWRPLKLAINFQRPIQSLWETAKATLTAIIKSMGHALFGRKKRDLLHGALLTTHKVMRASRDIDFDYEKSDIYLNETIDIVFQTAGFRNATTDGDYGNRVAVFRRKCTTFKKIISFLGDANSVLYDISNETYTAMKAASKLHDQLKAFDIDQMRRNFSLESSGINPEAAMSNFNLSREDLHAALTNANDTLKNDSLLSEIQNMSEISKMHLEKSSESANSIRILDQWVIAMENATSQYFENDTCVSFLDCAHYCIAELLDLYYAEEFDNISGIFLVLSSIEDTFLELISNSTHPISTVYNLSDTIRIQLNTLENMNPYCSIPPTVLSPLTNRTVASGTTVELYCNVSGRPEPNIWWYLNDEYIPSEHEKTLVIQNTTVRNVTQKYRCIAGNVVANLTSDDAFLNIEDEVPETLQSSYRTTNEEKTARLDLHGYTEPGIVTRKIDSNKDEETELQIILIPVLLSLVAITAVAGVVLWRFYARNKFRKANGLGSFMSLNMVKPTSAKPVYRGNQPSTMSIIEPFQ